MGLLKNIALAVVSLALTLALIELALRFFPVTDVIREKPLAADSSPFQVSALAHKDYDYSRGWDFHTARTRRTNNEGFFSDFDYEDGFSGIVAVGDSFVEAMQVDFDDTFHQRLAKNLGVEIYNVALSGAPLSQYQAYVDEICERYRPTKIVIPIINNDFDESLYEHRSRDGFFNYDEDGTLRPTPYSLGLLRQAANASSLVRYVYFHLSLGALLNAPAPDEHDDAEDTSSGQDTPAQQDEPVKEAAPQQDDRYAPHRVAAGYFLDNMAEVCVAPSDIVFVVDALRSDKGIYGGGEETPFMREFADGAARRGFSVIDLTPVMKARFEATGERFEFPDDAHWNARAHALIAETLADFLKNQGGD
jgi:hypothetical protein